MSLLEMIQNYWAQTSVFVLAFAYAIRLVLESYSKMQIKRDEIRYLTIFSKKTEAIKEYIDLMFSYYFALDDNEPFIRRNAEDAAQSQKGNEQLNKIWDNILEKRMRFAVIHFYLKSFLSPNDKNVPDACFEKLDSYWVSMRNYINNPFNSAVEEELSSASEAAHQEVISSMERLVLVFQESLLVEQPLIRNKKDN